jgi:hypothetical protein
MTTEQKIEAIKNAIEMAKNHQSKMDQVAWDVPALSSLKIRHLMNNLGAISTRYMEHGTHKGGVFCSVLRNNPNIEIAWWGDSFASDKITGENVEEQFMQNAMKCIDGTDTVLLGEVSDTFDLRPGFGDGVDLYFFDADHSYEAQRKAMTHFLLSMANEFIVCVDDWQYGDVKKGTIDGILDSGCEILFQEELLNTEPYTDPENDHRNEEFWRGFYVALLRKKPVKKSKKK